MRVLAWSAMKACAVLCVKDACTDEITWPEPVAADPLRLDATCLSKYLELAEIKVERPSP